MFDVAYFLDGALHFVIAFGLACVFLTVFKWLYQISTPYDERALIAANNPAAGIALGGAIIGFALPLASALSVTVSVVEFTAWALLAGLIQIVAAFIVRRLIVRDMVNRIEEGNIASAIYSAATSIGLGLLNAASMTY